MADPRNVLTSKKMTTAPVRAVFPYIHEVAKFGDYEINVDLLAEPELHAEIQAAAKALWAEGAKEHGFDPDERRPDNALFREGTRQPKDGGDPEDYFRVCFKMKAVRRVKKVEVPQKPQVVDSQLAPMTEAVFSGSVVQIRWYLQFTHVNGKFYITPRFTAVKVISLIGPNGEETIDDAFDADDDGFTTKTVQSEEAPVETPVAPELPAAGDDF